MRALEEEEGDALAHELGAELAKLHQITPATAPRIWASARRHRQGLVGVARCPVPGPARSACPRAQPVLEWAINRLEDEAPTI